MLNNAFSIINLVMGYYYMSDAEVIPVRNSHRQHRKSKKISLKRNSFNIEFYLTLGTIVGFIVFGIFMMNELWNIKKSNKGIIQIKTNLMSIQQKVMEQEMNFSKLIKNLTRTKKQEVVQEDKKEEDSEEDSEEDDDDEEN